MISRIVVTALVIACASLALAGYTSAARHTGGTQVASFRPNPASTWSVADQRAFVASCLRTDDATAARCDCALVQASTLYPTAAAAATMPADDRAVVAATCRGR